MKPWMIVGAIVLVFVLLVGGILVGAALGLGIGRFTTRYQSMMGPETAFVPGPAAGNSDWYNMPCAEGEAGPGMMGSWGEMPCEGAYTVPEGADLLSLEEAEAAVQGYLDRLGYDNLYVTEVMEFAYNFYAIAAEEDTGIGAMELLVDKTSGSVGLEPGPNMMWNARYGMHRGGMGGMMGGYASGAMRLSPGEAEEIAQRWLDANLPGRTAGEADAFYGYYTLHFLRDGEIEGMLSVHGASGEVWYHDWHGDFVAMTEEHS